jgi:hypothetical protein
MSCPAGQEQRSIFSKMPRATERQIRERLDTDRHVQASPSGRQIGSSQARPP